MAAPMTNTPAGWYPNPDGKGQTERWWTGSKWGVTFRAPGDTSIPLHAMDRAAMTAPVAAKHPKKWGWPAVVFIGGGTLLIMWLGGSFSNKPDKFAAIANCQVAVENQLSPLAVHFGAN